MRDKTIQKHKFWTTSELRFLRANLHMTDQQLADALGRTKAGVNVARKRYRILKEDTGTFKKGHKTWNKGIKYVAGGRSIETQFKKGQKPINFRPVGTVFTIPDNGKLMPFIKLETHRQYPYSRYLFEQHYGVKLSKDEIIRFADGNSENLSIENLIKVTRKENISLNHNRKKAGETLKKTWLCAKTFNDFGYKKSWYKNKRKAA